MRFLIDADLPRDAAKLIASYGQIWSERDGPPYEVWVAPSPLPDVLKFRRDDKEVKVRRSGG